MGQQSGKTSDGSWEMGGMLPSAQMGGMHATEAHVSGHCPAPKNKIKTSKQRKKKKEHDKN